MNAYDGDPHVLGVRDPRDSDDLRAALADLPPKARHLLSRVLMGDVGDRAAVVAALLPYRETAGDELAGMIDFLTLDPEERRKVVRLLAEIDAV